MPLSPSANLAFLALLFQNVDWAGIGDVLGLGGSASSGSFWISLHSDNPLDPDDQTSDEVAYSGYSRVEVVRGSGAWTLSGTYVQNVSIVEFATCGGGSVTATHFGVGTDETGPGSMVCVGTLTSPLDITSGIQPKFGSGALRARTR